MKLTSPRVLCLIATSLMLSASLAKADSYAVTILGGLGGNSSASSINNSGTVVGSAPTLANPNGHAVLWNGTTAIDLTGSSNSVDGAAWAINQAGQIVGNTSMNQSTNNAHAVGWFTPGNTNMQNLSGDPSNGTTSSYAFGINNAGKTVGWFNSADFVQHATLWQTPNDPTDLGGGAYGYAVAQKINNLGQVVGYSTNRLTGSSGRTVAEFWSSSLVLTHLGTLGGTFSYSSDINDAGQIVGSSRLPGSSDSRAVLWRAGAYNTAVDLGTLGGASSFATAINSQGLVVGQAQTSAGITHATLWTGPGAAVDLNGLVDPAFLAAGWVLSTAADINDNGLIVGTAFNSLSGLSQAFVLTPSAVPEPQTQALFLAGLAFLWGTRLRRATAQAQARS